MTFYESKMNYGQDPARCLHDISGVHINVHHDVAAEAAFSAAMDKSGAKSVVPEGPNPQQH